MTEVLILLVIFISGLPLLVVSIPFVLYALLSIMGKVE